MKPSGHRQHVAAALIVTYASACYATSNVARSVYHMPKQRCFNSFHLFSKIVCHLLAFLAQPDGEAISSAERRCFESDVKEVAELQ